MRASKSFASSLSIFPKVLYHPAEPEVFRTHAGLAARLLWRQPHDPGHCAVGQGIDRLGLAIGGHESLELTPELIHRTEFGPLFGQPEPADVEFRGQRLRAPVGVSAGPVGEQPDATGPA